MSAVVLPVNAFNAAMGSAVAFAAATISGATPLDTAACVADNTCGVVLATAVAVACASTPAEVSASVVSVPSCAKPNNVGSYMPTAIRPSAPTPAHPPGIIL